MFAYNLEENQPKSYGLNKFSNDEIYCSDFSPSPKELQLINNFIEDLKKTFPLEGDISIYISFKRGVYLGDVRAYLGQEPTFANSSHSNLRQLLESLKSYLIVNSVYEIDKGFRYFS